MPRLLIILFSFSFFMSCHSPAHKPFHVQRAFYYWKSVFRNNPFEQQALKNNKVDILYIKFFDVDWNYVQQQAFPLAQIQFADQPGPELQIIPAVFITNRCMNQIDSSAIPSLAENISSLLEKICLVNALKNIHEIQIDCDWSEKTRDKYFYLLQQLK